MSKDISRREETEGHARVDLAAVLGAYVSALVKRYSEDMTPGPADALDIAEAMAPVVSRQAAAAPIQDRWVSKDGTTEFAEAQLDLESFKDSLLQLHELSDRMRQLVKDQAVPVFDALSKREGQSPQTH